ncbi:Gp49 family protein [Thioalkalivibrio sp. ARh3]|uniref:Gp49 family protein n=1 Tax=Thioalkalivibrio sp. ARh3 TaxID=1158148 RepID=UPI00035C8C59|nr:Gp49 family protein [Thioalkalivibrio sp. ARh3]
MQTYIGVKQVQAEPQERDGEPGYRVVYPDGYESWSPARVFEAHYLGLGDDPTRITGDALENMDGGVEISRMGNHTVVRLQLRSGFSIIEESACVDPDNYDESVGTEIAMEKARDQVWAYLGFVLAWARNGLRAS